MGPAEGHGAARGVDRLVLAAAAGRPAAPGAPDESGEAEPARLGTLRFMPGSPHTGAKCSARGGAGKAGRTGAGTGRAGAAR